VLVKLLNLVAFQTVMFCWLY